jgi:hypothetical protein
VVVLLILTNEFNFTLFNFAQAAGRPDHQNVDCEDEYQDDDIEHVEVIHERPDDYEYEYDPDDPSEQRPDLGGDEDEDNLGGGGVPPSEPPKEDEETEEECKERVNQAYSDSSENLETLVDMADDEIIIGSAALAAVLTRWKVPAPIIAGATALYAGSTGVTVHVLESYTRGRLRSIRNDALETCKNKK